MRLTTKGRFAVTAMIDLAMRYECGPVALIAISRRQQISLSYLEHLFGKLRRRGLVRSTRGPGGGYTLGCEAGGISLADIVAAVDVADGLGGDGDAKDGAGMQRSQRITQELWAVLDAKMFEHLASVSLQQLVADQIARGVSTGETPAARPTGIAPVVRPQKVTGPNSVFALGAAALAAAAAQDGTQRFGRPAQGLASVGSRHGR